MTLNPITIGVLTAVISSLASALVATLISLSKSKIKQEKESLDALNAGMRALLWRELNDIYKEAITDNGLTTDARHHLENVYLAYHRIGGNGTGTRLFDEAMKMPIIHN